MATFLVCHGAWSSGWAWKKMRPLVRAAGHEIHTPTYTGIGERGHLVSPQVGLETHIEDVLAVLHYEDLSDVVLVGHSYGGMVSTGVADRARDKIARLIYVDAFVPEDGQSLLDLQPAAMGAEIRERAKDGGLGWMVPSNPIPPDTSDADVAWITPRRMMQPLRTFESKLRLRNGPLTLPRDYVYCLRIGPGDIFRPFADRARKDNAWGYHEIDASHSPHVTAPEALRDLLVGIAEGG